MNLKEAVKFLKFNKETHKVRKVSETTNYFIFNIVPVGTKGGGPFVPAVSVDKRSGATAPFNPMRIDKTELKTMKQIWPEQ